MKPLSYRTNNGNSRSNSLLTSKCELLLQMTVQLYPSLFTFTISFIPMSIKRLVFDYKPVSGEKLAHVIGSAQDFFSNYLNNMMKRLFFCKLHLFIKIHMVNIIKGSKFNQCSSHKLCIMLSYSQVSLNKDLVYNDFPYLQSPKPQRSLFFLSNLA